MEKWSILMEFFFGTKYNVLQLIFLLKHFDTCDCISFWLCNSTKFNKREGLFLTHGVCDLSVHPLSLF